MQVCLFFSFQKQTNGQISAYNYVLEANGQVQ